MRREDELYVFSFGLPCLTGRQSGVAQPAYGGAGVASWDWLCWLERRSEENGNVSWTYLHGGAALWGFAGHFLQTE